MAGNLLLSVARIAGTITVALLSAYLGVWFCCTILQDQGKGLTDSSFVVCFFLNVLTLTALALLLRSRWWEALAPFPIPLAFAIALGAIGFHHEALMLLFAAGLPVLLSAAATRWRRLRGAWQC